MKRGFGKTLKNLHSRNAWTLVLLTVSGILLYLPPMRAFLGEGRVWLKQLHIAAGMVSIALLVMYTPHFRKHLRQLSGKPGQRANLAVMLLMLLGWAASGLILWRYRWFSPVWTNWSLFIHDGLSWVGIPYAIYHSLSRSRWVKQSGAERQLNKEGSRERGSAAPSIDRPLPTEVGVYDPRSGVLTRLLTRRNFLRVGTGSVLAAVAGPFFYKWLLGSPGSNTLGDAVPPAAFGGMGDAPISASQPVPLPDSLPPIGKGAKGHFRIYTVTDNTPEFKPDTWSFRVDGLVERAGVWSWEEFLKLPRKVQVSDFHCVTGWSVTNCTWEGIPLTDFLTLAGVKPEAKTLKFYSSDGVYTDSLTLEQAKYPDIMVVVLLDGKPIPKDLGGPVRLVVPQMYAYKSVKWLHRIELISKDHTGYWEERGYSKDAWVHT